MQQYETGYGIYGRQGVKRYALHMKEITPQAQMRANA